MARPIALLAAAPLPSTSRRGVAMCLAIVSARRRQAANHSRAVDRKLRGGCQHRLGRFKILRRRRQRRGRGRRRRARWNERTWLWLDRVDAGRNRWSWRQSGLRLRSVVPWLIHRRHLVVHAVYVFQVRAAPAIVAGSRSMITVAPTKACFAAEVSQRSIVESKRVGGSGDEDDGNK
jgi:hypothetical protein